MRRADLEAFAGLISDLEREKKQSFRDLTSVETWAILYLTEG